MSTKVLNTFLVFCLFLLISFTFQSAISNDDPFLGDDFTADFLPIDKTNKYKLFFWLFKSRDKSPYAPLVIFLNGGPGSSGEEVVLMENGPFRINNDLTLRKNLDSYINTADVMYLDQPIGTGYSVCNDTSRIPKNQAQAATDLAYFFNEFYEKYANYKGRRTFFTGQSFAGHYIPGLVPTLIKTVPHMNVKGVSVGNGAISIAAYAKNNIWPKFALARDIIGNIGYVIGGIQNWLCGKLINMGMINIFSALICSSAMNIPINGRNRYDYTTTCKYEPDCYDFRNVSAFLKQTSIEKILRTEGMKWEYTNLDVNNAMLYDNFDDYSSGFTDLLSRNISVTLYYGEKDYICNYEGGLAWLNDLNWQFTKPLVAQKESMIESGIGHMKGFYLFNYIRLKDAGHFVTMDKPEYGPFLIEALVGKGLYKFKYSEGIVEIPFATPERTLKLMVATRHQVFLSFYDPTKIVFMGCWARLQKLHNLYSFRTSNQ